MKNKGKLVFLLMVLLGTGLTGCGEKAIELSKEDEKSIAIYASNVVRKYNGRENPVMEEPVEEETEKETEATQEKPSHTTTNIQEEQNYTTTDASSIEAALGLDNTAIVYKGSQLTEEYQTSLIKIHGKENKTLLVINLELKNTGSEKQSYDIMKSKAIFRGIFNNQEPIEHTTTIALEDFSTFRGEVQGNESVPLVLFFEVDPTEKSYDSEELEITINEKNYKIKLK